MENKVVIGSDCCNENVLCDVYERLKEAGCVLDVSGAGRHERTFYQVAEAFDNYREAYVSKSGIDEALLALSVAAAAVVSVGEEKLSVKKSCR